MTRHYRIKTWSFSTEEEERERRKGYTEMKTYQYDYKNGEIDEKSKSLEETFTFDKEGNIITDIIFRNGQELSRTISKYNSNNVEIETIEENKCSSKYREIIKYDNNGNEISYEWYNKDGKLFRKSINEYDDKGNEIYVKHYDEDGKLTQRSNNKYDDKGHLILFECYDEKDELIIKHLHEYDDKGNEILYERYQHGKLKDKEISKYEYGNNGNKISGKCYYYKYDKYGKLIRESTDEYKYNDKGNEIFHEENENGVTRKWIYNYKYNDKGNIISDKCYYESYENGTLTEKSNSEDKYDDWGNGIEIFEDDKLVCNGEYNDKGLLVKETEYNENGEPTVTIVYEYK